VSGAAVDIIIVAYNRRRLVERSVRSASSLRPRPRIFLVDNGNDGTGHALARQDTSLRVLDPGSNLGFGRAVNLAAREGNSEFVLLLNGDAQIEQAAFERLCAALAANPTVAGVGPRIRDQRGVLELSVGRTLSVCNEAIFRIAGILYRDGHGPARTWIERRGAVARSTRSLSAACLLMRRAAFEEAGGFDERFFLYAEDVDLCLRLSELGWSWHYVPAAKVVHERGASAARDRDAAEAHYRASQLQFYGKHNGAAAGLFLRTYLRLKYGARWLLTHGERRRQCARILALLARPSSGSS